ncbi:MAG: hypothetical protein K8F59_06555, partial [Rhodobacteraceae bacterium]|nr:hypothetical protein [Paracoccaceae bacterium]
GQGGQAAASYMKSAAAWPPHRGARHTQIQSGRLLRRPMVGFYSAVDTEARNFLLDQTEEPVVAFLDSDDAWHPDHLADFAAACPADKSVFYFTDFRLAQSRRRISFAPPERRLGYLIRQPILLSSVIVQKGDLRFRNIRAEDFIFNHDAMKRAEIVIHHPEVRVIYDQTRTARKTMRFRVRRTYRIMQILTGSHLAAAFLTLRFIATFAWRKAALRLRPASNGDIG